ncbi:hypothetical protein AALB47_09735 [Lachnospiraceae bacterium 54-11]|jgi:hypothetical protein|nr:hypothetical protein [Lachnospiraceae bacterium]
MLKRVGEKINKRTELCLVILLAVCLVLGVTLGMGTLTCGWHLVDDHEFLRWFYELKVEKRNVFEMIGSWLVQDFAMRYEPLYYTNRILSCFFFGINLLPYSILKSMEIIVSCVFLYYCGRLMGANKGYSFLFAAVSLTGYQSAVWWKLGPQEPQCTLLFSIGFYCMLKWLNTNRASWAAGSIFAFFVMCNYKESFILLLPFLMLYVLYHDLNEGGREITWSRTISCIKKKLWYYLVLGIIFTVIILFIVFYVGVNNYDKAGLDISTPWAEYAAAFNGALETDLKWFKRFGIAFCLILLTYWDELKKMWREMLLITAFLLPQFAIFAQAGIRERYILPASIGFSMFFILMVPQRNILSGKRKLVYQLCILLLLLAHGRVALREADYFRYRGESVTTMLNSVMEMSKGEAKVLSCLRPNEEGNITMHFWMASHGYDNVYYWTEEDGRIDKEYHIYEYCGDDAYENQSFEDMDIVVMYNREDRHWCYEPGLDLSDFCEIKCGTLNIYVRNGSGIEAGNINVEGLRINF